MNRTHEVSIYRKGFGDPDSEGMSVESYAVVEQAVGANLQPITGAVRPTPAGREVEAQWRGFVSAGTDIQVDDGVLVTSGVGPTRYKVTEVGDQGPPWDIELLLELTEERFDAT